MTETTEPYDCTSLTRAAWLIANGIEPSRDHRLQNGWLAWEFPRSDELNQVLLELASETGAGGLLQRYLRARLRLLAEAARSR